MHPVIWILWLAALTKLVPWILRTLQLERANFRGSTIPASYGLYLLFASGPAVAYFAGLHPGYSVYAAFVVVVTGFGLLGFLDDLFGSREHSGLKGHIRAALDGHITTGFIKATGGIILGFLTSALILKDGWSRSILDGLVIALCANAINLLDLRPGRASAVVFIMAIPIILFARESPVSVSLLVVVVPLLYTYLLDSRGLVMLGDSGSNLLGGAIGLALVLTLGPVAELLAVLCLVALHIFAERRSLTRTIEENPLLRRVDFWTGIR